MSNTWSLDFFKSDTYTPTIGDGTNNFSTTTSNGLYRIIGNMAIVNIDLVWNSKGSASAANDIRISLPFTVSSSVDSYPFLVGEIDECFYNIQFVAFADASTNYIFCADLSTLGNPTTKLTVDDFESSGGLKIQGNVLI